MIINNYTQNDYFITLKMDQLPNPKCIDTVIFHHVCMDGFASAFIAKYFLDKDIKLIPKSLDGKPIDVNLIKNKNVLMVDIVVDNFNEIKKFSKKLVILDHHKTNQEKLKDVNYAYFDMNKSGVGLAWEYFYGDEPMPLFLQCIQDRDLWTWDVPLSRNFCEGLFQLINFSDYNFNQFYQLMDEHFSNNLDENITEDDEELNNCINFKNYFDLGKNLNKIKNKSIDAIIKYNSVKYKVYIDDRTYIAYLYNVPHDIASDLGNKAMLKLDCDFVGLWRYNHNEELYNFSLRSTDNNADVSEISKFFGGGGHRNAAGFSSDLHPKELFKYERLV